MRAGLNPRQRKWLKRIGPAVLGLAAIGVLVVLFNPAAVGAVLRTATLSGRP